MLLALVGDERSSLFCMIGFIASFSTEVARGSFTFFFANLLIDASRLRWRSSFAVVTSACLFFSHPSYSFLPSLFPVLSLSLSLFIFSTLQVCVCVCVCMNLYIMNCCRCCYCCCCCCCCSSSFCVLMLWMRGPWPFLCKGISVLTQPLKLCRG